MAFINAAEPHGRRSFDRELPLVPFIDFLLCLVAFLLVSAVWTEHSRLEANARVPGPVSVPASLKQTLHVSILERSFELSWKQGATVVHALRVQRTPIRLPDGTTRYPELARILGEQWKERGVHRSASDPAQDVAVLHSTNAEAYGELVSVMDALHAPTRTYRGEAVPAFALSFAAN
jgi:biopolymer transport protein ExbD